MMFSLRKPFRLGNQILMESIHMPHIWKDMISYLILFFFFKKIDALLPYLSTLSLSLSPFNRSIVLIVYGEPPKGFYWWIHVI
jgi:hypothetical protein